MIPKIIHQTWKTTQIPDNWLESQKSCKALHPDYKYILWTDDDMDEFVKREYPNFYQTYISYKYHIQRCDAFRYLVLYKYGGIYLDLDIVCKKNLNNFINYDLVLTHSSNIKTSLTNSFIMIIPEHPFFKYCIDQLPNYSNSYSYFGKHLHIMNSTGPIFLTNMIYNYGKIKNTYFLNKNDFAGDCNVCNKYTCSGSEYFSHLIGQSWNSFDSHFYNFCLCNYMKIIFVIIMLIILFLIYKFYINKNKKLMVK
jgi:mannosyltransferase OCH1-like enzyme